MELSLVFECFTLNLLFNSQIMKSKKRFGVDHDLGVNSRSYSLLSLVFLSQGYPTLIYIHGGGWRLCGNGSHDSIGKFLVEGSGFAVAMVQYRLSPGVCLL